MKWILILLLSISSAFATCLGHQASKADIKEFRKEISITTYQKYSQEIEALEPAPFIQLLSAERVALRAYTDSLNENNLYWPLNSSLWRDELKLKGLYHTLCSALTNIRSYIGTVFRGKKLSASRLEPYYVGNVVTYKGFTSTSKNKDIAMSYAKNTLFIIKSKSGKHIESISAIPKEKEVLFPAYTKFHVDHVSKDENDFYTIEMSEI